jgi:hypothetical protein
VVADNKAGISIGIMGASRPPASSPGASLVAARQGAYNDAPRVASTSVVANMPLLGPIPVGQPFFCSHCGALYSVTNPKRSKSDSDAAKCVVCGKIMDNSDSTDVRIFKLVHRPEDA